MIAEAGRADSMATVGRLDRALAWCRWRARVGCWPLEAPPSQKQAGRRRTATSRAVGPVFFRPIFLLADCAQEGVRGDSDLSTKVSKNTGKHLRLMTGTRQERQ